MSERAFQWDCEFSHLPVSFYVPFSMCECTKQLLCVIAHLSMHLFVSSHGPQVSIITSTLHAQLPGCKNLAGFWVMCWPRPGAGGWLWERRQAWEAAPAAYIPGRSREAKAATVLTPMTSASAACLPTQEGLPDMLSPSLPGQPQAQRPSSQGHITSQLSGGCGEVSDEPQHMRAHGADRLSPRLRVTVEVWELLCLCMGVSTGVLVHIWIIYVCP